MSTAEEIRASLAPIVDRLIQKNPGLARDFQTKFPTRDSATQWVSYELSKLSKEIAVAAAGRAGREAQTGSAATPSLAQFAQEIRAVIIPFADEFMGKLPPEIAGNKEARDIVEQAALKETARILAARGVPGKVM
ncbi:MAG TPA: hypothetical protein VGI74_11065 [Streptosporangiaceae bacterium]